MINKNIKVISVFILGVVCALGITISAYVMNGKKVLVKVNGWNVKNAEEAVDYLKDRNKCKITEPPIARVTSGDKNTIGSVVQIDDEEFYIIGQGTGDEAGKTKLFVKNNLKNNNQVESGATTIGFADQKTNSYWKNKIGTDKKYPGSYDGSPYPYVYDENSNLYPLVEAYAEKISDLGINDVTGRLITYEELIQLSSEIRASRGSYCYWTGSAYNDTNIWFAGGTTGSYSPFDYYNSNGTLGVRPVILVPTNKIR